MPGVERASRRSRLLYRGLEPAGNAGSSDAEPDGSCCSKSWLRLRRWVRLVKPWKGKLFGDERKLAPVPARYGPLRPGQRVVYVVSLEDVAVGLVARTWLRMVIPGHLCTCVAVAVDEQKSRGLHDLLRIGQKTGAVSGHHLESLAGPFLTDSHSIGD
jgi:hypothetical protein